MEEHEVQRGRAEHPDRHGREPRSDAARLRRRRQAGTGRPGGSLRLALASVAATRSCLPADVVVAAWRFDVDDIAGQYFVRG